MTFRRSLACAFIVLCSLAAWSCTSEKALSILEAQPRLNEAAEASIAKTDDLIRVTELRLAEAIASGDTVGADMYRTQLAALNAQREEERKIQDANRKLGDGLALVIDEDGGVDYGRAAGLIGTMVGGPIGEGLVLAGSVVAIGMQYLRLRNRAAELQEARLRQEQIQAMNRMLQTDIEAAQEHAAKIVRSVEILKSVEPEVKSAFEKHTSTIRMVQEDAANVVDRIRHSLPSSEA